MARFHANENFPLPVVEELRHLGHDVITIQEAGYANRELPDDQVLASVNPMGRNRAETLRGIETVRGPSWTDLPFGWVGIELRP